MSCSLMSHIVTYWPGKSLNKQLRTETYIHTVGGVAGSGGGVVGDSGRGRSRRKNGWQNDYVKWRGKELIFCLN